MGFGLILRRIQVEEISFSITSVGELINIDHVDSDAVECGIDTILPFLQSLLGDSSIIAAIYCAKWLKVSRCARNRDDCSVVFFR